MKRTIRTLIQTAIGLAVALPILVDASGVPETLPGVGVALAISGFVTRIMAIPQVQTWLSRVGLCDGPTCPNGGEDQ